MIFCTFVKSGKQHLDRAGAVGMDLGFLFHSLSVYVCHLFFDICLTPLMMGHGPTKVMPGRLAAQQEL